MVDQESREAQPNPYETAIGQFHQDCQLPLDENTLERLALGLTLIQINGAKSGMLPLELHKQMVGFAQEAITTVQPGQDGLVTRYFEEMRGNFQTTVDALTPPTPA